MKYLIIMSLAVLVGLVGCDSSDPDNGTTGDRYALRIVNTTSSNLIYSIGNRWCYGDAACTAPTHADSGGGVIFGNQSVVRSVSTFGEVVTGVGVRLELDEGAGRIEVLRGSLAEGGDWDDFQGTVVHQVPLQAGAPTSFTWSP